jgi:hypothetical protein
VFAASWCSMGEVAPCLSLKKQYSLFCSVFAFRALDLDIPDTAIVTTASTTSAGVCESSNKCTQVIQLNIQLKQSPNQ